MVGKRQNLRHENSRDVLCRIDPVIRVEKAGPGHASGAAPLGHRLHVDHVTEAPFQTDTGEEVHIVGERRRRRFHMAGFDIADLILPHQCNRLGAKNAHAVELATAQQHADKPQIIRCC